MGTPPNILTNRIGAITLIGAGNTGSQLGPLLARMSKASSVTIVDHDFYEEKNLASQAISTADVGRPKAVVQAERLRAIKPGMRVTALVERVENVPPGVLRADVIAGCLDSRRARRIVNRIAWTLGIPFVDAGVQADGMLARINVYRPGADGACYECAWDEQDYANEEAAFSCDGTRIESAPTNAPATLGALAAALQAIEIEKILAGDWERVALGREVLLDANFHRHFVTRLPRNPDCRCDHRTVAVREFPGTTSALTLAHLFGDDTDFLRVEGQAFASRWVCVACSTTADKFGLRDRIAGVVACPKCGKGMRAIGFQMHERLSAADVPEGKMSAPLSLLGFCTGDIFSTRNAGGETHFELTAPKGTAP